MLHMKNSDVIREVNQNCLKSHYETLTFVEPMGVEPTTS